MRRVEDTNEPLTRAGNTFRIKAAFMKDSFIQPTNVVLCVSYSRLEPLKKKPKRPDKIKPDHMITD